MKAFLLYLGVNPVDIFAGFTGGMLAALATAGPKPSFLMLWNTAISIVCGVGTAAWLGPMAPGLIGLKPSGGASFILGFGAMPICKGLFGWVGRIVESHLAATGGK